jgi:hypothetical protein
MEKSFYKETIDAGKGIDNRTNSPVEALLLSFESLSGEDMQHARSAIVTEKDRINGEEMNDVGRETAEFKIATINSVLERVDTIIEKKGGMAT